MKKNIISALALIPGLVLQSCGNDIPFDACGQIEATEVTVSAEANGKILSLDVMEGDKVVEGAMIGAIDSNLIVLQIAELRERIGGTTSRLVDIHRQMEPNRNQMESLERDLERYRNLLENNAATQKQVDDITDKIRILKAQMAAQRQTWERGNSSVASEMSVYQTQLAQKEDQLAKCRITVPVTGTVLTKYAEKGETVTGGKPLFKLADLDNVYVRAYFTTEQLSDLKLGDTVTVIPDDGTASPKEYQGKVTSISGQAEFTPKNIQTRDERADMVYAVKVAVPNDGALRLGMYAYIRK